MIQYTLGTDASPDLAAIECAIAELDPSVQIDLDASGQTVRISTLVTRDELLGCLHDAGATDPSQHLTQVPSDCCGGCGG